LKCAEKIRCVEGVALVGGTDLQVHVSQT